MSYIIDVKNFTHEKHFKEYLSERWTVTELSPRTFKIEGPEIRRGDLLTFWNCIGNDGHVFTYDCETRNEGFLQRRPRGRKLAQAPDSALDEATLTAISDLPPLEVTPLPNEV